MVLGKGERGREEGDSGGESAISIKRFVLSIDCYH